MSPKQTHNYKQCRPPASAAFNSSYGGGNSFFGSNWICTLSQWWKWESSWTFIIRTLQLWETQSRNLQKIKMFDFSVISSPINSQTSPPRPGPRRLLTEATRGRIGHLELANQQWASSFVWADRLLEQLDEHKITGGGRNQHNVVMDQNSCSAQRFPLLRLKHVKAHTGSSSGGLGGERGGIMLWGCFSTKRTSDPYKERMNGDTSREVLGQHLLPSVGALRIDLLHDNDPRHAHNSGAAA